MPKNPKPPEEMTPKERGNRAISLAYKAAKRGDEAVMQKWLDEAAKDGYQPNSKDRRQLTFLLEKARETGSTKASE